MRRVIGPRFQSITPDSFGFDILQETICKTMDAQAEQEKSGAGRGLQSISNDGYSETYATTTAEAAAEEMAANIRAWLSGTGMAGAY